MKTSLLISLASTALICMYAFPCAFAVDAPTETMLLKAPAGAKTKKNPVTLSHAVHAQFSCQDCHHTWDGTSPVKKCTDSGCHDMVKAKGKAKKNIKYYETAYHQTCYKGCHKTRKKARKSAGPTSCSKCHLK